jgi:hypothetical protein
MAHWFTRDELGGYPVELAMVSGCDLLVLHLDGEWHWLVQRADQDLAEGVCCSESDARTQAEIAAYRIVDSREPQ